MIRFPTALTLFAFIAKVSRGQGGSVAVSSEGGPSLEEYLCNGTLNSNTTLELSAGEHHIPPGRSCRISNLTNIGISGEAAENTTIQCHGDGGFEFAAVTNLTIQRVTFLGCGQINQIEMGSIFSIFLQQPFIIEFPVVLLLKSVVNFSLKQVSVKQFTGIGLYGHELTDAFLNKVEFSGCYSNCSGAIFNQAQSHTSGESTLLVDSCKFTDLAYNLQTLAYISAGLTLWKQRAIVTNSLFSNNSAQLGSALIATESYCQLTNTTVENNLNSGIVDVYSSLIASAVAAYYTNLNITESIFQNNEGGAIYIRALSSLATNTITITNSKFHNNSAESGGAILMYPGSLATIQGCNFSSNSAKYFGGAINAYGVSFIVVSQSFFYDNTAEAGAAIGALNVYQIVVTNQSWFYNNKAELGGAISAFGVHHTSINQSWFYSNTAEVGGAIALAFTNVTEIRTSNYSSNNASQFGGAIFVSNAKHIDIVDCEFSNNSANASGGGVVAYDFIDSTLVIKNCAFNSWPEMEDMNEYVKL